jgi:hypothetical protein
MLAKKHKPYEDNSIGLVRPSRKKRLAPVVVLFLLAPLVGEYLLGNLKFSDLALLPFMALLYGTGAILIRETARHLKRGLATMLGLGIAYSLVEETLVDQMLFNPQYFEGQGELMHTVIPAFGIDVGLVLLVTAMHAIWSMLIPILIVEGLFPKQGKEPWLGKVGVGVVAIVFVLGSAWLSWQTYLENNFFASLGQLFWAFVVVVAIVAATLAIKRRPTPVAVGDYVPHPFVAGVMGLVASSLFMIVDLPGWWRVVGYLAVATVFFTFTYRLSCRAKWTPIHTYALAGGAILTYSWLGAVMTPETGPKTTTDHIGTAIIITVVLWLCAVAFHNIRRAPFRL